MSLINTFSNSLQNVTDPSEWHATKVPALSTLDTLQRCYICKEFMKAPVSTSCNHTFCSHCIREYLISKNYCPLCKTEQFESNLKREVLLEEIISCYASLRPLILDVLKNSLVDNPKPSFKLSLKSDEEKTLKREASLDIIEISSDEPDLKKSNHVPKKMKKDNPKKNVESLPKRNEMVECPICSEIMAADILQIKHIDDCLSGKKTQLTTGNKFKTTKKKNTKSGIDSFFQRPSEKSSPISTPKLEQCKFYFDEVPRNILDAKKLPKLDYASLTTPKLKEKMATLKLPLQGTRQQLELRYNHYYVLFNSNLDSNHPAPEKILKQKLSQWEHSHLAFNSPTNDLFSSKSQLSFKSITDNDFSAKEWLKFYRKEYKQLIKQAKKTQIELNNHDTKLEKDSLAKGTEIKASDDVKDDYMKDDDIKDDNVKSEESPNNIHTEDLHAKKEADNIEFDIKSAIATSPLFFNENK